jgi:hypothetical protein
MPDVSGFPALDVAIGLAFLFFLLSTACSGVNEAIASVLGWRAKTLEDAIRNLLGDSKKTGAAPTGATESGSSWDLTTALFGHWQIKALVRDPTSSRRRRSRPSYLPAPAFSLALVQTLAAGPQGDPNGKTAWQRMDEEYFQRINTTLSDFLGDRPALRHAAAGAEGKVELFREQVERAFNDAMGRASGWYKRKVQVVLAVIAAALAIGLNVDTVQVGTRLWKDPALRSAVVARASATGQTASGSTPSGAQTAASDVDKVKELNLPVGWGADNAPKNVGGVVRRLPGWLITIAALSLGAPFWFDLLSRFARLRGSGVPDEPRHLSDKGGTATARGGDAKAAA